MSANESRPKMMLRYATLDDYSARELINTLISKVLVKLKLRKLSGGLSSDELVVKANLVAEVEYYSKIADRIRPQMLHDPDAKPAELVAEKMWPWFVKSSSSIRDGWAVQWQQDNPLDDFGTTNEGYRRKWLKKTLSKIPEGLSILDAGAGERQYQEYCSHLKYTSQDFAEYNGDGDGHGLQMGSWNNNGLDIVSDISSIPVDSESFDVIMCTEVFEHIPKPLDAISEFTRILKPGGTLILTAPFAAMTHFAPYFFHTGYSKYFYETTLSEYGYRIDEIDYNGNYFEYIAQEVRRFEDIASNYGIKVAKESNIEKLAKSIVLTRLSKIGKNDKSTKELLCNGIHIRATKL